MQLRQLMFERRYGEVLIIIELQTVEKPAQ
jgi:hypothetical protein